MARRTIDDMRLKAEQFDRRQDEPGEPPAEPETPAAAVRRLGAENAGTPVTLSDGARRGTHALMGIDPGLWEEDQRLRAEIKEQDGRAA